jgi:dynamin GTPase
VTGEQKSLAAVQALLAGQGPHITAAIPRVVLVGQSVSIPSAQSGGSVGVENSLETVWGAESESLKSILSGAPPSKLGRVALVDVLWKHLRNRMKVRLPNVLTGFRRGPETDQGTVAKIRDAIREQWETTIELINIPKWLYCCYSVFIVITIYKK